MDSGEAVDTSTLTSCSGVPTRRKKVLHGPSFPSLNTMLADDTRPTKGFRWIYKYSLGEMTIASSPAAQHFNTQEKANTSTVLVECIVLRGETAQFEETFVQRR